MGCKDHKVLIHFKSVLWINSWKSPSLSQNSKNIPPTHYHMKLPSPWKLATLYPGSSSEKVHILVMECVSSWIIPFPLYFSLLFSSFLHEAKDPHLEAGPKYSHVSQEVISPSLAPLVMWRMKNRDYRSNLIIKHDNLDLKKVLIYLPHVVS